MNFAQFKNLGTGDVIITPKSAFNVIKHFVVFEGYDNNGVDYYLENKQGFGVRRINGTQFQSENPTYQSIRRLPDDYNARVVAINRGKSLLGRPYNLQKFNCEHFANYVQYNTPISAQVNDFYEGVMKTLGFAAVGTLILGLVSLIGD